MDEKLTPADVLRKGIDAVADAENKGINIEKDTETSFNLSVDDDAVEFSSFSIADTRDTTPGSKAGTRLPTVSLPNAKGLADPAPANEPVVANTKDVVEKAEPVAKAAEPVDIYSSTKGHSRTWLRNHGMLDEAPVTEDVPVAKPERRAKTQEELLAEILADTPEERRRKEAAKEEGVKLAQDLFSKTSTKPALTEEEIISEPTRVINTEAINREAALDRFLEESKRERRAKMQGTPESVVEKSAEETNKAPAGPGGYFGRPRKRGFSEEAVASAAGGRVIESEDLAVDPTTLTKKELREYNRINKRGAKAEKKAKKRRLRVWQKILIILLVLILLIVGTAGVFFGRYYGLLGDLDISDNPISKITATDQSETNEKTMNILLVGLDSRKDNYTGRSDSMILVTINKQSKKLAMTSFLRDSYVDIPGYGSDKLNSAYAKGGANLLTNTIYENFDIVVDRTAVFNFLFVIDLIDALGGVTVEVTAEELPYLNMYIHDQNEELYNLSNPNQGQINSGPGTYTLTGNQALAYARIRYVGTDVARSERQRTVLQECIEKANDLSYSELNKLMTQFLPRIKTDLSSADCLSLITTLVRAGSYQYASMAIPTDNTWKDATVGDQEVIKITDYEANIKAWEELVS